MTELADVVRERAGAEWCLFLDRDGVINRRVDDGYVRHWDEFDFIPGAIDAVAMLTSWAPRVVVVTNQQGIAKGAMTHADVDVVHARMLDVLASAGAVIDAVLVCPHLASAGCPCRKPQPGLANGWLAAHTSYDGRLSAMVGDSDSDMSMAHLLGAATGGCQAIGIAGATRADLRFRSLSELARELEIHLEGATP